MRLRIKAATTVPGLVSLIHRLGAAFRVLHHLQSLLLQELFLFRLRFDHDAMWSGMVVFVQIRESGETISGDLFRLTAAVHLRVDRQRATTHGDDLAFESDNVARKNRELEVDAVKHEQDRIFRINILRHSEIGAFQEPLRATTREEGLVMVQVCKFDESLGISCFHISYQLPVNSCQLNLNFHSIVS